VFEHPAIISRVRRYIYHASLVACRGALLAVMRWGHRSGEGEMEVS
jgi:hypothetical protein